MPNPLQGDPVGSTRLSCSVEEGIVVDPGKNVLLEG
jgi:hypothetical protein